MFLLAQVAADNGRALTTDSATVLVNTQIISRLDYCNYVPAGVYDVHLQRLQKVLNASARFITLTKT